MNKGKSYACRDAKENVQRKGDFYPTPESCVWCAESFFKRVIPLNAVITEPCCGNGQITEALKKIGYTKIIENDKYNKREDITHLDVIKTDLDQWATDYVVTNFPFSCWDDCVRAFLAKSDIKVLITIGRLNYLSTQSRIELWEHLKEIHIFSRYIDYRTPERKDGCFNVGAMATGWFYFSKEKVSAPIIKFVDVQKYAVLGNVKVSEEQE